MSDIRRRRPADSAESSGSSEQRPSPEFDADAGLKHGVLMQIARSILLVTWFLGCCVCILATQLVGAPLYFVNQNYYYAYMAFTKQCFGVLITTITQWGAPTKVRVSGDESVRGQIQLTAKGLLKTDFPNRLVFIANHQIYTDWLYLWWVTYTARMHGHIYIILKESIKYIPILGQGILFYGFIFMARKWEADKPRMEHRLRKLKSKHTGPMAGPHSLDPMWLLIFPEGTNLSINTKNISNRYGQKAGIAPLKHMILPRSTGLFFCLQQLQGTVDYVYDCTVGYEGPPRGVYPDRYFTLRSTYLQGRPPKSVNMYWRRWAVADIPLNDSKAFETWLLERWREKDALLDHFFETGRFPTSLESSIKTDNILAEQKEEASQGYAETQIKLTRLIEIGQIFGVLIALGLMYRLF